MCEHTQQRSKYLGDENSNRGPEANAPLSGYISTNGHKLV